MNELIGLETPPTQTDSSRICVHVKLIGVLASAAGTRQIELTLNAQQTVSGLVLKLLETIGKRQFEEFLVDSGTKDPRPNVIILLNEQDCNLSGGLKAIVQPDTKVTIIPVAHGG